MPPRQQQQQEQQPPSNEVVLQDGGAGAGAGAGDGAGGARRQIECLRIAPPREISDGSDVCLARAYVVPARVGMRVRIRCCKIARVTDSRKNTTTIFLRGHKEARRFMMDMDARITDITKNNIDAWFMHKISPDLVDEYYRSSTTADHLGVIVRAVIVDGTNKLSAISGAFDGGASVDLHMQLLGVQFRRQYFAPVWRLLGAEVSKEQPPPVRRKRQPAFNDGPLFSEDEEDGDDDADEDVDDDAAAPCAEECAELRQQLVSRLINEMSQADEHAHNMRELIDRIESSAIDDIATLDAVSDALESLST